MNRHRLARFLRLGVMSCVLLSCLIVLQTPALAIASYDALAQVSVLASSGTQLTFSPAGHVTSQFELGNAGAFADTSTSLPATTSATVTGFATGPSESIARSSANADSFVSVVNQNATTGFFPVTVSYLLSTLTTTLSSGGAKTSAGFDVLLDGLFQGARDSIALCGFDDFTPPIRPACSADDSGSINLLLPTGGHSLEVNVFVSGEASAPELVPEPTMLLLFGTTLAGLGLARWRRRTPG